MSGDIEILAYSDMVVNAASIEILQPLTANKLPVSHKMCNRVLSSNPFESVNQINAFLSIGVASLIHHRINNRECHSIIDNSEGENIDIRIAALPVCPIHRKIVGPFDWN